MTAPSWLSGAFAGLMIALAAYCLGRLVIAGVTRRPTEHDLDGSHLVMGIAMAGMLVSGLRILPDPAWAVIFGLGGLWFAWRSVREYLEHRAGGAGGSGHGSHRLPHLIMCGAMVYMLLAMPAPAAAPGMGGEMSGMAGMGGMAGMDMGGMTMDGGSKASLGVVGLILAVLACGYAVWETDRLQRLPRVAPAPARLRPALAQATTVPGQGAVTGADLAGAAAGPAGGAGLSVGLEAGPASRPLSPRLAACCKVAMAVTMGYMFVTML